MEIAKGSGKYKILDSNSIIMFDNQANISFNVKCDESFSFNIVFNFNNNEENKNQDLKFTINEDTLTFTCVNFNNPLGTGTKSALEIATFMNKKIFIHFWVVALGNDSLKKLDYTLYQES